jgi:hypothetical protein
MARTAWLHSILTPYFFCALWLQPTPSFGEATFRIEDIGGREAAGTVFDKTGRQYVQKISYPALETFKKAKTVTKKGGAVPCGKGNKLRCLPLIQVVRLDAATVRRIYLVPIPDLLIELNVTETNSKLPPDISAVASKLLRFPEITDGQWLSLELTEEAQHGEQVFRLFESLVGQESQSNCIEGCRGYFSFETPDGDSGVAACTLFKGEGISSPPHECSAVALTRAGKRLVRTMISPDAIGEGFGAGAEILNCFFSPRTPIRTAAGAVKSVLEESPLELSMNEVRRIGESYTLVGSKNSGESKVLASIGQGVFFERLTFHGLIFGNSDKEPVLNGTLSINVNRQSAALDRVAYELGNQSEGYAKYVASLVGTKLQEKVKGTVQCKHRL